MLPLPMVQLAVNGAWNPSFSSQVRRWTYAVSAPAPPSLSFANGPSDTPFSPPQTPNYFITHTLTYAKLATGGTGSLLIQPSGASGFSLLGSLTALGDATAAATWGTTTPRLGFAAATGGCVAGDGVTRQPAHPPCTPRPSPHLVRRLAAAQYVFNVAYSAVQQCSPPASVVLPAGIYASNDAAGASYTYSCLPGYSTVGSPASTTLPCGSTATSLASPPTCFAPTAPLGLTLNANTWTLGGDAVWAAANSPNGAPGAKRVRERFVQACVPRTRARASQASV